MNVEKILSDLEAKHPGEKEYLQAVKEVLLSVKDVYEQHPGSLTVRGEIFFENNWLTIW